MSIQRIGRVLARLFGFTASGENIHKDRKESGRKREIEEALKALQVQLDHQY